MPLSHTSMRKRSPARRQPNNNPAGRRIIHGVGHQIEQHAFQQYGVAADPGACRHHAKRSPFSRAAAAKVVSMGFKILLTGKSDRLALSAPASSLEMSSSVQLEKARSYCRPRDRLRPATRSRSA